VPEQLYTGLDIMRQINGHHLFLLAEMLGDLAQACAKDGQSGVVLSDQHCKEFESIRRGLERANLSVCFNIADTYYEMMQTTPRIISYGFLGPQLHALKEGVFAELRTMLFFRMDEELRIYFEKPHQYGDTVDLRFPAAALDIEEAGKCLALARPTAAIFHAMRVMEVGLRVLAKDLKIPYAPSWESYIRQIEAQITAKHKSKSKKWKAVEPFYRELLGDIMSIKIAWRNPTMHIVRSYTPNEAEDVFRAVRTFMQRLSTRLAQV